MKIAVMQPYFLPYIGYFQLINYVDVFVFFDDVNYIKKGFINRNSFILPNGEEYNFTLPLVKASQNKLINEIEISDHHHNIDKTIEMAYKNAKFYDENKSIIYHIFNSKYKNLSVFVETSVKLLSKHLGINTGFYKSSDIEKDNALKGKDKIIEICKAFGAKTYANPIGGMRLYNKEDFEKEDISLEFLEYIGSSKVSIIDPLMKYGKNATTNMLGDYRII